jgi:N-acetylmuramate 1-kinase
MSERENALKQWLSTLPMLHNFTLTPLAGDASFRRYYRLTNQRTRYIVMDAPPEKESLLSFILVNEVLRKNHIHAPEIIAKETLSGFLLLEDLGDTLLSTHLQPENMGPRYEACLKTLIQIQQCPTYHPLLPKFDTAYMLQEMMLFRVWFLEKLLGLSLDPNEEKQLNILFMELALHLSDQPQCFIHRDYHSRNLLILPNSQEVSAPTLEVGVIDFQDAMKGPFTYDLVSLLKDCYIHLKDDLRHHLIEYFYLNLPENFDWSLDEFERGFNWCGLQRHLKVLGIFSRLYLRDGKANYLKDLPLTLAYTTQCAKQYPAFHFLYELIEKKITPVFQERQPA